MEHHSIAMHESKRLNSESIKQHPCICETLFNNITDRVEFVQNIYQMLSSKINFDTSFRNHQYNAEDVDKLDLNIILADNLTRAIYNRGLRDGSKMLYKKDFKSKRTLSEKVCATERYNDVNHNLNINPQLHTTQCITKNINPQLSTTQLIIENNNPQLPTIPLIAKNIQSQLPNTQLIAENHVQRKSCDVYDVPKNPTNLPNNAFQSQFSIYDNIDSAYLPLPAMQLMMNTELLNLKPNLSTDSHKNEHTSTGSTLESYLKKKAFKDKNYSSIAKDHLSTPYEINKKKNHRIYKKNNFTNECTEQKESPSIIPLSVVHYMDKLESDQSTSTIII